MKLPRDLSGQQLAKLLRRHYGYSLVRRKGSHMMLTAVVKGIEHSIIVPFHKQLNVDTLASILADVAQAHEVAQGIVRTKLFG